MIFLFVENFLLKDERICDLVIRMFKDGSGNICVDEMVIYLAGFEIGTPFEGFLNIYATLNCAEFNEEAIGRLTT